MPCKDCKYWSFDLNNAEADGHPCKGLPPQVFPLPSPDGKIMIHNIYPRTRPEQGCALYASVEERQSGKENTKSG